MLDLPARVLSRRTFSTRRANAAGAFAPDPDAEIRVAAEAAALRAIDTLAGALAGLRHVLDVSDLVQYWKHSVRPTGIQRVQIEVVRRVFSGAPLDGVAGQIVAVFFDPEAGWWQLLEPERLLRQIGLSFQVTLGTEDWNRELMRCLRSARQYLPQRGDTIVNLGTSWWLPDYHYRVRQLRLAFNIGYVPFIHDVIPLVVPQLCDHGLTEEFRLWFRDAIATADHVIVNSVFSRQDVAEEAMALTGIRPAPSVVRLNAPYPAPGGGVSSAIVERLDLDISRYVLCVGTLEGRKNHILLFEVWQRLLERLPVERVARLVLVGKRGSLFEEAAAFLERHSDLRAHLVMLTDISDGELADLYRGAEFTVYPSLYEGWGLPITEAIGHGKLTVASNASSIPEVASPGDILLAPDDLDGWTDAVASLLASDATLAAATARSRAQADLRSWHDVATEIFAAVEAHRGQPFAPARPTMQDGRIYDFGSLTARLRYPYSALGFRRGNGWHAPEPWGSWSASGLTELSFVASSPASRFLYLRLRGGPRPSTVTVTADRSVRTVRALQTDEEAVLRLDLGGETVAGLDAQEHTVRLSVVPEVDCASITDGADRRVIGVGVLQVMSATRTDMVARLDFLEATQMQLVASEQ